ncbi:hypothetical protein E2562_022715 [Oryza meyeriana var. granulata]|uniref:Uncharacterized protein n=1 Tax=Oryza meyeriana var. granulata TaxID=110450 RepID=A0A6G1E025_9ORYZ|nr:hypothetical protein E2562_022715 [Oryza meyeriana var. granulata]
MGRSPCCDKARVKRGPWSQEEDAILRSFVERFGNAGNWIALPHKAGLKRCGKSCRLRWLNYLRPAIRHGGFTDEEDNLILSLYSEMGSKWSVIASKLPGRTDNDVKNYWNTKLKKRYLATTREATPPPPAGGDDSIAVADSPSQASSQPSPPPTLPALVNLDTAGLDTVDDNDELLHKSEQLYAELMGLIEQQSVITAAPSTGDAATTLSWSPSRTSPTASSDDGSSLQWPVDVHDSTVPLSESSSGASSLFFNSHVAHAFGGSFQDLLGSASFDDVMLAQEMLYY